MVLCTAVAGCIRDIDFCPLTVDVEERMYATGKIPGSFFKREGRPGEKATLTARMIDRPIRPLFPKDWRYDTQLVAIPISIDHVHPYDILAMNGASAALMISDIPLPTPVGAVRIGKIDGNFVVNPPEPDAARGRGDASELDLIVAGTEDAILMVEAGATRSPRPRSSTRSTSRTPRSRSSARCSATSPRRSARPRKSSRSRRSTPRCSTPRSAARTVRRSTRRRRSRTSSSARTRPPRSRRRCSSARPAQATSRARCVRGAPRGRSARLRQAREVDHPRAHRGPEEAPGRTPRGRDPRHHDRSRRDAPHARVGAVHARPDAGAQRRRARHAEGGDAPRHARPGDQKVLLAPLQLPAVLGRGGGPHRRRQAPRHRPRGARRARARAGDPVDRGVPLLDPRRVRDPGLQRLDLDGVGLRRLAVPHGRRRPDHAPRWPASRWA